MTDGWWRFTDRDTRPDYPLLSARAWHAVFERERFTGAVAAPVRARGIFGLQSVLVAAAPASSDPGHWLVLADAGPVGRQVVTRLEAYGDTCAVLRRDDGAETRRGAAIREAVDAAIADPRLKGIVYLWALHDVPASAAPVDQLARYERDACGGVLDVLEALASAAVPLTLVTRGAQPVTAESVTAAPSAALWGLGKVIALERPELRCRRIDLDPSQDSSDALVDELLSASAEDQVGFRAGRRHVARLVRAAAPDRSVPAIYKLETLERGVLDQLRLVPTARREPQAGEVEIAVQATALNFADVMDALGVRPGGAARLGGECAGLIVAVGSGVAGLSVGDEVVAIAEGCYANHVTCSAALVVRKPSTLSAAEAASLPIAFITARHSLLVVAGLRAGEKVLIHAAAGGVGLAAVQVAQSLGVEIFATAGSAARRAHLAAIGVPHVMSSRTTDFAREIVERTGGTGVHVVLNSLAGEFIAPSFDSVAAGGRFIEIGKTGWSSARAATYRADVQYHVVDWAPEARVNPGPIRSILEATLADAGRGVVRPLPLTGYDAADAVEAFRSMAQARHIGKVVICHAHGATVRPDASYLVTGGLSGLGLLAAERLVERGARSLLLMGRRGVPDSHTQAVIARLEAGGARVTVVAGDVSSSADVTAVFASVLPGLPPLRGIVHSAGVLDDGVLSQQTEARFETVMAPKVLGAALLDRLSPAHALDFFILFSSVASVIGSAGQANHAAANAYLDALAHSRQARGLVGSSINWGAWSGVGAAVAHGVDQRIAQHGVGMIDPSTGLARFESVIGDGRRQVVVLPVNWTRYAEQFATRTRPVLLSTILDATVGAVADGGSGSGCCRVEPAATARGHAGGHRPRLILSFVREQALTVLGLPAAHAVGLRQPLSELGLDSLMAVEFRNTCASALERTLPATLLFDYPTIEALGRLHLARTTRRPESTSSRGSAAAHDAGDRRRRSH